MHITLSVHCENKQSTWANSVCLTKIGSKLELSLMQLLRAKIWKNLSVDKKDQRSRSVWVGQADFSKIAQSKQNLFKHVNCVFTYT